MENSIYIGLSRQMALRAQMDLIANNVANMSTPGYRSQNMVFEEYVKDPRGNPSEPISMVSSYGQYQNTQAGPLTQTGAPLDVALQGPGYFGIQTNDGVMYSRAGNFQINAQGELTTGSGQLVAGAGGGTITIPSDAKEITITKTGSISTDQGQVGQLMIKEFDNLQALEAMGNGLYKAPDDGADATETEVIQGMLEGSNVTPVLEMTRMIDVLRAYQMTYKNMTAEHDRQRTMIQKLSQVS